MRVLISVLIVLVAAPAWAVWMKVWESKISGTITYFDPDTIHKDGNLRRVWVLQDLKTRGKTEKCHGERCGNISAQRSGSDHFKLASTLTQLQRDRDSYQIMIPATGSTSFPTQAVPSSTSLSARSSFE